jgi:cyclase
MRKQNWKLFGTLLLVALLALTAIAQQSPVEFTPPALNPAGGRLETKQLGPGIYALVSSKPPVDNSGFVVGERGVLVIDAHINREMAKQIQSAVREVTDKPILYLINTNYHGDHTFGNYAFPAETMIVAQRKTAERMRQFEQEKQFLLVTVDNDPKVFGDVQLRLPDVIFDDYLRLDLGKRIVELYHFGPGNTPGDTVVYVPEARAAWTGNLIFGKGTIPFLIESDAGAYLQTVARFAQQLDVETIVPGHGPLTSGATIGHYAYYLAQLIDSVRKGIRSGQSLEEVVAVNPLWKEYETSGSPDGSAVSVGTLRFLQGLHKRNLSITYREMKGDSHSEQAKITR